MVRSTRRPLLNPLKGPRRNFPTDKAAAHLGALLLTNCDQPRLEQLEQGRQNNRDCHGHSAMISPAHSWDDHDRSAAAWSKNPRVLAGRLPRAQAFLRVLGIDVAFGREGRAGTRVIRIHTRAENTVSTISTVSSVRHNNGLCQPP